MIGLVIVTQDRLAFEFRPILETIVGPQTNMELVAISLDGDMEEYREAIIAAVEKVEAGSGTLIVTDMFGGSPSNLSISVMDGRNLEVVSGVNLPMLIKVASVRENADLEMTARQAQEAGRKYINIASDVLHFERRSTAILPRKPHELDNLIQVIDRAIETVESITNNLGQLSGVYGEFPGIGHNNPPGSFTKSSQINECKFALIALRDELRTGRPKASVVELCHAIIETTTRIIGEMVIWIGSKLDKTVDTVIVSSVKAFVSYEVAKGLLDNLHVDLGTIVVGLKTLFSHL